MVGLTSFLIIEGAVDLFVPDLDNLSPYWNYGLFYDPLAVIPFGYGEQLMESLGYEMNDDEGEEGEDEDGEEEEGEDGDYDDEDDGEEEE